MNVVNTKLLDTDALFDGVLTASLPPGVTPVQEMVADSYDEVPFVSWSVSNNGQYDFGLWAVTLVLNVVAELKDIEPTITSLYEMVRSWEAPGEGGVPGVGWVLAVSDGSTFDKVGETLINNKSLARYDQFIHGKHLMQFAASFNISVQQAL